MNAEITNFPRHSHRGIIEKYKFLPGDSGCASREYEILPDGYFDLAFLLSDTRSWVALAGPYTRRALVRLDDFELFVIRFKVGRVPELEDIKPSELVDTMIQLPMIFGMRSDNLCEILWGEKDFHVKQRIIEDLMDNMELRFMMKNSNYCRATALIESHGGQIKVSELSHILGVSTRTLERQFVETLGVTPKQFIRLVRFQRTVEKMKKMDKLRNLTDIAHDSGYCDQSHFIKDFKLLSGRSPHFL